jgi:regulator of sirC expression with transglutaminase-like and TPR domain
MMSLQFTAPTPLEYFRMLVESDEQLPLLEAAASMAQDEYPDLDLQVVLGDVDQLLARLKRRIPADAAPLQRLRTLNQFFFRDLSFGGNVNDYCDPDNSYLNVVLRTRRGIQISLAVLWIELAQGIGLHARGVCFPGHFMVKVNLPKGQVVIDPFTGQSLSREELSERLEPYKRRSGLVDEFEVPLGLYLQAAPPRDVLARMLRNLKEIHRAQEDWQRLIAVQNRLLVLLPDAWAEYRDRGLAHAEQGHTAMAVDDLENYLVHAQDALDIDAIADRVADLRRASSRRPVDLRAHRQPARLVQHPCAPQHRAAGGRGQHALARPRLRGRHRVQHRPQPVQDRLPLFQVGGGLAGRQVEHRQPAFQAAHVQLRLAQQPHHGHRAFLRPGTQHFAGIGAAVHAHADGGDAALALGHARQRHQLRQAGGGGFAVEDRGADRDHDRIGEHHDARQLEAMHPAGRIQHHVRDAGRHPQHVLLVDDPGRDARQRRVAPAQPAAARLLAIDVAQHHGKVLARAPRRHVGGESALAAASLAVDDRDHRHPLLPK